MNKASRTLLITSIAFGCTGDPAGDGTGASGGSSTGGSAGNPVSGSGGSSSGAAGASTGGTIGGAGLGSSGMGAAGMPAAGANGGGTAGAGGALTAGMGGTPIAGMGGASIAGMGGASIAGMGGAQIAGMGGTPIAGMGGTPIAGMGGTSAGGMSGSAGSGAGGSAGAPPGGFVTCPYTPPADPTAANYTAGTTTLFNNNGAWTWYSDERAIVDAAGGKIVVSSDANPSGATGSTRNGTIEAVIYDVATLTVGPVSVLGDLGADDHNNAAFLVKPGGRYLAFWAGHNENCNSYWRNHDGSQWGATGTFDWTPHGCPFDGRSITYNNLWNMTAENKIYNFVRSVGTSPNMLVSTDNGATWSYGGRLTSTPTVGYVAGYYKYWGNQVDRIDFFGTEAHPRNFDNNLFHGYVRGGKSYTSTNVEVDANIADTSAPQITAFTRVFTTQTTVAGTPMHHAWNSDVVRYDDGTIAAIGMARTSADTANPDHAFLYFRFNGTSWSTTYLGKAGKKLYDSEQDYVGLGALHPDDPRIIYISSHLDPRNDMDLGDHEVFMGVTCDNGATFQWTPVTWNSSQKNIRPVVPKWNGNNMALLWLRGSYSTAQIYNMQVVGIVTRRP